MKNLIEQIQLYELTARELDIDLEKRQRLNANVLGYADQFLAKLPTLKAYQKNNHTIGQLDISEEPIQLDQLLKLLDQEVDTVGVNPASGNYCGYIPGGGLYTTALADYLSNVTNRYSGMYFTAPGAIQIEKTVIEWACKIVGYDQSAFGNLSSGGSLATLIAIVTARTAHQIKSAEVEKTVVYLTAHTHHCFKKALRVAGLEEVVQRIIPLDHQFRMDVTALKNAIEIDKNQGLHPWFIAASAGTADVGAVDPLAAIAAVAQQNHLWLHLDAAYGGFFVLTEIGKKLFSGLNLADSIVLDPHKGLFLSYGLGMVLVKNHQQLLQAHQYTANILQDAAMDQESYSPVNLSPELTRPFRGLKLWMSLHFFGVNAFRACLEEKLLLAQYFYRKLKLLPGFEIIAAPVLSIVVFRYLPEKLDVNLFNQKLHQALLEDGRIFLSTTLINDQYYLRFACLSFRTHLENVDLIITILLEKIKILSEDFATEKTSASMTI